MLRVKPAEKEAWERAAAESGLSLAAYVRRAVGDAIALELSLAAQADQEKREERERLARQLYPARAAKPKNGLCEHRVSYAAHCKRCEGQ